MFRRVLSNKGKGAFTLVEILVAVSIIVILATIAIPGLVRSRMNARASYAMQSLRSLASACQMYANLSSDYPTEELGLAVLGQGELPFLNSDIVNAISANTAIEGFYYQYSIDPASGSFIIIAEPQSTTVTLRHFRIRDDQVIQAAPVGSTDWLAL